MQKYIISAAFFAVIYWIYAFEHPEWCNYHEQYQMFLFGWDYLADHLCIASGMADYLAEFVVQFFLFPYVGAALWAGMLVWLGVLVWRVAIALKVSEVSDSHFALALAPSIMMSFYCGNQYVMLAFPMSLILSLLFFLMYNRVGDRRRMYAQLLILPAVYWIVGYGVFVYAILSAIVDGRRYMGRLWHILLMSAVYILVAVISVLVFGYTLMRQYPFIDLFCGVNFYLEEMVVPSMQHYIAIVVVLAPLLISVLPKCGWVISSVEAALALSLCPMLLPQSHNPYVYSLLKMDYLVRNQEWNGIIEYCKENPPQQEMGYTALNLALAKTNQLSNWMFAFPQAGHRGLISVFERDMVSGIITAEVFHHLGLVNQVLRIYFDSQASILNCNRSARFVHRIAECHLVNGNYNVAARYINLLKKTLYYSQWAEEAEACLYHPDKVASNKRWSALSRHKIMDRTMYRNTRLSDVLVELFRHSPDNTLALQYALACDLLKGDIQHFMATLPLTQPGKSDLMEYVNVPKSYQEAVLMYLFMQREKPESLPPFISQEVFADFQAFDQMMRMGQTPPPSNRLYATFWRYMIQSQK